MTDLTLIKSYKIRSKGKSKGFSFNMELTFPPLKGIIDSSLVGGVFINECVDYMRGHWKKGLDVGGIPAIITKQARRRREQRRTLIERTPTTKKEYNKWIKDRRKIAESRGGYAPRYNEAFISEIVELKKHYHYRVVTNRILNGIKTRSSINQRFVPNDENPALNDSGLMIASLSGKSRPPRSYIDKQTGIKHNINTEIIISVAKSRQKAAIQAGLSGANANYLINKMKSNNSAFRESTRLLKEGIYWSDNKADVVKILTTMRLIARFMSWTMR